VTLLLLLILAHLIADFVLQTDAVVRYKCEEKLIGTSIHFVTILLCNFFVIIPYGWYTAIKFTLIISVMHIIFDVIKVSLKTDEWWNNTRLYKIFTYNWLSLIGLTFDQLFHLITIFIVWKSFAFNVSLEFMVFLGSLNNYLIPADLMTKLNTSLPIDRILIMAIAYTGTTFGGAVYTRKFIDCLYPSNKFREKDNTNDNNNQEKFKSAKKIGKYIGLFERFFILTLILNGAITAVAFVMTAKSIARYKLLEEEEFAEYFLIGTMFSVSIAIIGGISTKYILNTIL